MYKFVTELIKKLAVDAGAEIMNIYQTDFHIMSKMDNSPLTAADKKANTIIISKLEETYKEFAILSEEEKDNLARLENDYCFIVDPLDGTKEFINRNGEFTVNIALAYKHEVVIGVIYVPVTKELYYASKGEGAFYENLDAGELTQIHVTDKLSELVVVGSRSHAAEQEAKLQEEYKDIIAETRAAGSSLKGCMVAKGDADVYYRFGLTCEWDTAAMQCIVEEAGGIFRQMDGTPMRYNRENTLNEKGFYIVNRKENIWV